MAAGRRRKQVEEAAKGDAYEPLPGEIVAQPESGHADKVDKTRAITDVETGMKFAFNHVTHAAEITFSEKPSAEVRQLLKDNQFAFGTDEATGEKVWHAPIKFNTREQDRLHAKRSFWKAADMRREELGLPKRSLTQESEIPL